ncbi:MULTISPECIES: HRDC domain-containing protein [Salinicola]|uniref:Ribonuclease D n=1 Tax=Salinicola socius TaxID=404433 RepID=A0A1Q8SQL4_9GAMM|nr:MULTISPECIES: HRDC domain-containing protein [Salinicola]OLO03718.1 ribonuclease D [Salinicola socius]
MSSDYSLCWVDTPEGLQVACEALTTADIVALDTEFFRESSFYPVPALIQLTAGDVVYLVDPKAVAVSDGLQQLLSSGPPKLIHACSEDLEVLSLWAGVKVAPLIDTQVAESFLGSDPAMGYRRLVAQRCGVDLPKEETRSNWLERPLTPAQLDYAALDVVFLPAIWDQQRQALTELGRESWFEEECVALSQGRDGASGDQWYARHRQLWRLKPRQIEAYRELTVWREAEVRRRDVPRGWLAKDSLLFAIADAMPQNRYELAAIDGMTPTLVKREGDALLALVKAAHHRDEAELCEPLPIPTSPAFKRRLKALKQVVQARAEALGVAPERLSNRTEMEAVVAAHLRQTALPLPSGWRGRQLAAGWEQALAEQAAA